MTNISNSLSPAQLAALDAVKLWLDHNTATKPVFRLFGYAGTGKSTLAPHVAQLVNDEVIYLTYTGKAASVLRQKGCADAQTLHSAMYTPFNSQSGKMHYVLNKESNLKGAKLVLIDECSMVDDKLFGDLLTFGVPILAMGDPAQLPPVNGVGILGAAAPDVFLTEVHRQSSGNPILQLATHVRCGGSLSLGDSGGSRVVNEHELTEDDLLAVDQIIVGSNSKRRMMNDIMRALRGFAGDLPVLGDRLVCLRNHAGLGIANGEIFTVVGAPVVTGDDATFEISSDDPTEQPFKVTIAVSQFLSGEASSSRGPRQKPEFDFGYALTCHKAQGSQWRNILVIDESHCFGSSAALWLYTAITRAQDTVTIAM